MSFNPDLKPFMTLDGITGASGLVYKEGKLYIISDDSDVLYVYDIENYTTAKIFLKVHGEVSENIEKALKPDFESIAEYRENRYIFGSGSAKGRFDRVKLDKNFRFVNRISIEPLYRNMMKHSGIEPEDFNIEGVIIRKKEILFFNRGNGPGRKNGIFSVKQQNNSLFEVDSFHLLPLLEIKGFPFTFSDAVLYEGLIYFLAAAEKTESVYVDGEVLGSALGILDSTDFELKDFKILTNQYKLEGLTPFPGENKVIRFLACEDADDSSGVTRLFLISL